MLPRYALDIGPRSSGSSRKLRDPTAHARELRGHECRLHRLAPWQGEREERRGEHEGGGSPQAPAPAPAPWSDEGFTHLIRVTMPLGLDDLVLLETR